MGEVLKFHNKMKHTGQFLICPCQFGIEFPAGLIPRVEVGTEIQITGLIYTACAGEIPVVNGKPQAKQ